MRSKLFAMTALTPSSCVPFAAQSRDAAGAVFLAAEHDRRRALLRCTSSPRRRWTSARPPGWNSVTPPSSRVPSALRRQHQVLDAHVGERAAHHHLVVAAARAVAVEVGLTDTSCSSRHLPAGEVCLDRAGGRDVVGGDRVAEDAERARAVDVADRAGVIGSRRRTAASRCRSTPASCRPGPSRRRSCSTSDWRWRDRRRACGRSAGSRA